MGTKNNPGAFDCHAAAHPDEPLFTLLGRDPLGASLVTLWALARDVLADQRPDPGREREKVAEAMTCVDAMKQWLYSLRRVEVNVLDVLPFDILAAALRRRGAIVTPVPFGGDQEPPPAKPVTETHVDRMRAEHSRLAADLAKLERFIGSNPIFSTLEGAEQSRMERQREAMSDYLRVLGERISALANTFTQAAVESEGGHAD